MANMDRRQAFALLFEPAHGWADDAALTAAFNHFERALGERRETFSATTPDTIENVLMHVTHVEALAVWQALSQFVDNQPEDDDTPPDALVAPAERLLERIDAAIASLAKEAEPRQCPEGGECVFTADIE
jgi:hypothetical protein